MRTAAICTLSLALLIFLISACAQPSRVDKDYGRSVKQAQKNQILDPRGESNLDPVTGIDGKAAQASIEKYRKTFEQPREIPQPIVQTGTQGSPTGK